MIRPGLLALAVLWLAAGAAAEESAAPAPAPAFAWRRLPNGAFSAGESILYVIKYGFISGGHATLEVPRVEDVGGRKAYYLLSQAKTNSALDVFFKVRDRNESWMDVESLCSLRYHQNLREGLYRRQNRTDYDHPRGLFSYWKKRKGKETTVEGPIPPFVQDVLSSLYYLRTMPLEPGKEYTLEANSGAQTWPLKVVVKGIETIRVPAGHFECLRVQPMMTGEGIFQQKGELEVWMTNDARRVPVLLRSKVLVGAFDAEMEEYVPPAGEAAPAPPPPAEEAPSPDSGAE